MNGLSMLAVTAAAVLLLLGDFAATSALIPAGGKESGTSAFVPDNGRDGCTFSRREGCFGCQTQSMETDKGRQVLALRRLQQTRRVTKPPPAPIRNTFRIWSAAPAPSPASPA